MKNFSLTTIFLVVISLLALAFFREPLFFTQPRIWAEEGTVHIASVFSNGLWQSLIMPHLGYYSLFNNYVVAFGLTFFGLSGIAYVTLLMSFFVILMTVLAPLILNSNYWDVGYKKILIAFFTLTIGSAEIWVNTVNSQFYFCLFAAFLLIANTREITGWKIYYVLFMIINGAFTGVTTVALSPFFIIKYLKESDKNKLDLAITLILILGGLIQVFALIYLKMNHDVSRFSISNLVNFPRGFIDNFTSVLFVKSFTVKVLFLLVITYFIYAIYPINKQIFLPLYISFYLSLLFAFLALGMHGGGRYGFVSAVLVFTFLVNTVVFRGQKKQLIIIVLLAFIFLSGLFKFFDTKNFYNSSWVSFKPENVEVLGENLYGLKVFPQWPNVNWEIKFNKEELERY